MKSLSPKFISAESSARNEVSTQIGGAIGGKGEQINLNGLRITNTDISEFCTIKDYFDSDMNLPLT